MDLYNFYQELYQLSQKQKGYIEEGNYDQLLNILAQKQDIIDKIDKIDTREYLKKQEEADKALEQLKKLIGEIKELEDKNQKQLIKNRNQLADKMLDFNKKQKSRKGYQSVNNYEAKFIDKKR